MRVLMFYRNRVCLKVLIAYSHTGFWQFLTTHLYPASLQWQRVQKTSLPNRPLYRPYRGIGNILAKFRFCSFKFRLYCNVFVIKQELKKKSERVKSLPCLWIWVFKGIPKRISETFWPELQLITTFFQHLICCKTLSRWLLLSSWQEYPCCLSCRGLHLHLCPQVCQSESDK